MRTAYFEVCMKILHLPHCEDYQETLEELYAEKARLAPPNHCTKPRNMDGWAARRNARMSNSSI
mgnify:CR=1 FL=1